METIVMDMTKGPDPEGLDKAGRILREGGLVAFPTETVYGLGGNALDQKASEKIYAAKGRPSDNPLIVHIAQLDALDAIVRDIPPAALDLAHAFWPGPLTMIFHKAEQVPLSTTGGLETVAVRMPSHPVAMELIRRAGGYVAAPSANTSGRPSPTKASHVIEDLSGRIDVIIDGGEVDIGLESTIVDLTEDIPTVLRPGYINLEMLAGVVGDVRMDQGLIAADSGIRPKAPGMKYRHYAPHAPLCVVEGEPGAVAQEIRRLVREAELQGKKAGILTSDEGAALYPQGVVKPLGKRKKEITISQHLFSALREFDQENVDVIYSEAFDTPQMGGAIMNRLLKAAGHTVIQV